MKRSFAPSAFPQSAIGSLKRGFAAFGIRSLNPCSIRRLLAFAKTAIAIWLWRRCSNSTRKSFHDNHKIRNKVFDRLGLLTLESFALCRQDRGFVLAPRLGQSLAGSPGA